MCVAIVPWPVGKELRTAAPLTIESTTHPLHAGTTDGQRDPGGEASNGKGHAAQLFRAQQVREWHLALFPLFCFGGIMG